MGLKLEVMDDQEKICWLDCFVIIEWVINRRAYFEGIWELFSREEEEIHVRNKPSFDYILQMCVHLNTF